MIPQFKKYIRSLNRTSLAFFFLGIGSTIWFLIRVIPKPSRAAYPCMRASAPFMSAFVLYLIGLASTVYIFKKKKGRLFILKGALVLVFVISLLISFKSSIRARSLRYMILSNPGVILPEFSCVIFLIAIAFAAVEWSISLCVSLTFFQLPHSES